MSEARDISWVFSAPAKPDWAQSLRNAMCCWVGDWGESEKLAWTYGIVVGWDNYSLAELAVKHGWDAKAIQRLKALHNAYVEDTNGKD